MSFTYPPRDIRNHLPNSGTLLRGPAGPQGTGYDAHGEPVVPPTPVQIALPCRMGYYLHRVMKADGQEDVARSVATVPMWYDPGDGSVAQLLPDGTDVWVNGGRTYQIIAIDRVIGRDINDTANHYELHLK